VWALVSRTDSDFEGFSWLHNVDAALWQDAPVEEGVAAPTGEFDEAKSLLRTEPFYNTTDRWIFILRVRCELSRRSAAF
jgi:hypothetical protein